MYRKCSCWCRRKCWRLSRKWGSSSWRRKNRNRKWRPSCIRNINWLWRNWRTGTNRQHSRNSRNSRTGKKSSRRHTQPCSCRWPLWPRRTKNYSTSTSRSTSNWKYSSRTSPTASWRPSSTKATSSSQNSWRNTCWKQKPLSTSRPKPLPTSTAPF